MVERQRLVDERQDRVKASSSRCALRIKLMRWVENAMLNDELIPPTALAAVMTAAREPLEARTYPIPTVGPDDVLVRVSCCTLCGSDLHTWSGRRQASYPVILGHEIVGTIAQIGANRIYDDAGSPLAVGDRVTWTLHRCCGECDRCTTLGLPMKCRSLRKYGHQSCAESPYLSGGLAEYCLLERGTGVLRLPAAVSDLAAAPVNCATSTAVAACEAANLGVGKSVLIQGAGALGCYAAAYAISLGCRHVIAADIDAARLEMITRYGATHTIEVNASTAAQVLSTVAKITAGEGVDAALELAGVAESAPIGLNALRVGGVYIECGCVFPDAFATIDMSVIVQKALTLRGVHNYRFEHLHRAVDLLTCTTSRYDWEAVVGEVFSLAEVNEAFAAALARKSLRVAVTFS